MPNPSVLAVISSGGQLHMRGKIEEDHIGLRRAIQNNRMVLTQALGKIARACVVSPTCGSSSARQISPAAARIPAWRIPPPSIFRRRWARLDKFLIAATAPNPPAHTSLTQTKHNRINRSG